MAGVVEGAFVAVVAGRCVGYGGVGVASDVGVALGTDISGLRGPSRDAAIVDHTAVLRRKIAGARSWVAAVIGAVEAVVADFGFS